MEPFVTVVTAGHRGNHSLYLCEGQKNTNIPTLGVKIPGKLTLNVKIPGKLTFGIEIPSKLTFGVKIPSKLTF